MNLHKHWIGIGLVMLALVALTAASAGYYWQYRHEQQRQAMTTAK